MRRGALVAFAAAVASTGCPSAPGLLDVPEETRLSLSPASEGVPPRGALAFAARGGSREGYRFSIAVNASGGTMDPVTGAYVAGARGDVRDDIQVEDSAGEVALATVSVGPGARVLPFLWVMPPWAQGQFAASGGSGTGWTWEIVQNDAGGTVDAASGIYRAGPTADASDHVRVTDSLGNAATARADVRWVNVWPRPVTVLAGDSQTFQAAVLFSADRRVSWSVVGGDGSEIVAETPPTATASPTCTFVAPAVAGTYLVRATSVDGARSGHAEVIVVHP